MEYQNPLNNLYSTQEVDSTKEITPIQKITDDIKVKADMRTKVPLSMIPNNITSSLSALQPDKKIKLKDYSIDLDESHAMLSSGIYTPRFESFIQGTDNQERLAQQQSTGEKWANGALKFGTKTLSAVVGGTVGLVYGVEEALTDGKFSSLYDNDFSNWMNDLDTKLNYQLPNYYTKQEQEKGLFGQMGTANFWSDKFLGGLSFTAGAIISEGIWAWATGGTSLATAGARWGTKLGRLSRWGIEGAEDTAQVLGAMSKTKSLLASTPGITLKAGKQSKDLALGLGKAGEFGSAVGFMARSAGYEASVEALQFKKEAEEKFYSNFADLNGREPNAEDIAQFEKDLESRANTVFGTNMAILGVSNLAMFGNVLDIKNPIKTGLADFIDRKAFGYGLEKTAEGAFKTIERTGLQKASRFTFNYVAKPAVTEGLFEEGGQGLTTKYNSKWLEHTYDPKLSKETFDSIGAFNEAIGEQYGTKEGWVENGLGILIGIVGGSVNARSQMKQDAEELKYKEAMANTWQDKSLQQIILPSKIQTANRIKGFALEAKEEALKGNIAKSELAKKSGQLAFINGELVMGSSVSDITSKVSKAMDTLTEEQWKEAGVENVQEYKDNALAEINTLAKEWKTNKKYWQYVIGDKLVGEQNLTFGAIDGIVGNFGKNASIVEAFAWQSTIGENANKLIEDVIVAFSNEVGEEYAKILGALKNIEEIADINTKQLKILQNQNKALKAKRTRLTNQITRLNTLEVTDSQKAKTAEISKALLETEEAINAISKEASDIADKINTFNVNKQGLGAMETATLSTSFSASTLSSTDLLSLDDNIAKFQSTLQSLEVSNPQRAKYLNELLEEYKQAKDVFLGAQATNRIVSSKDFKLENIGSFIGGKIAKNKAMNVDSQEWLQSVLNDYSKSVTSTTAQETEQVQEAPKTAEEIKKENEFSKARQEPQKETLPPLEQYKQRLETLLKTRYKDLISVEDETKPTQEEIQTFKDGKADDELKAKLSRWKLYDASIDEDGVSVADLITWINQAETTIEVEDTKDEIEVEDVEQIKDDLEGTNITDDYTLAQNTNGSATIVKPKDSNKYRLAHIKMQTLVDRLGGDFKVLRKGVEKEVKLDKLQPKDVVEVDGMSLTYLPGGQIEINQDDFLSRQQSLNLYIYNSGLNWSYKNLYEVKGNDFVKKSSDFAENEVNSEAIYDQKQGDKLTLEIDDVDGFNSTAFGGTKEQLKIYLVDSKGRKVSTLKAFREGKLDQDFAVIREEAFKRWEEQGRPSKMKLGIQVETENIFFGSPEIIMSENGTPKNIPITEAGVSQVVATGYIENGEISLNREIKDVSTVFVNKLSKNTSKKVPLIVIKKGAYSIAYPISMVKTATPQTELLDGILQATITPQEKVLKINEVILNQNIKTDRLAFDDINNQEKLDEVRKAFEDKKVFVDAKTLADKNYKIKNLINDAQINIDLENLDQAISDAKLRVSYKNTEIKVTLDDKNNNLSEVETELSNLTYELAQDYANNADTKYLDSKGDIIEDTVYTNAFDDNEITKAESHLDKMHNIKVLKQALSEKLSKSLEKAIGMDKIRQIKSLIKQYDFLKKQIVVSEEELKEGLNNTDCK
jgi:hypothetical protein